MHAWEETFKRAARGLSDAERAVLAAPARGRSLPRLNASGVVSSDREGMMSIFGDFSTFAGTSVTPETAMRLTAVYRSTALIAGAIASLPCPVYRISDDGQAREAAREHPLWWLLNDEPTARFSAATFWEYVTASMLNRGDGFAYIRRNRAGEVIELIPLPSWCVDVRFVEGRNRYDIADAFGDGKTRGFDQDDVLHFPGFGYDGLRSMSVIRWAAYQSIGNAIAMEEYAGNMMKSGALQKVVVTNPGDMTPEQLGRLRELWQEKYGGSSNSGRPMVLYGGMDVKTISLSAADSQLLESRRFQVEDIARAYGVPPFMIGAMEKTTSWGSGVESMSLGFLKYTLLPHLTRFQQEIKRKCFRISRYFVEFNVDGLLAADAKGRADAYRQAVGGSQGPGWMTLDEVRRRENLPPLGGAAAQPYDPRSAQASTNPTGGSNAA